MKSFFTLLAMLACIEVCAAQPGGKADAVELNDGLLAFTLGKHAEAIRLLQPLAQKNEPLAELILGRIYLDRLSAVHDCAAGAAWLTRAADHGNAEAAFALGNLYRHGDCGAKDETTALKRLKQAAAAGHRAAPGAIAEIYLAAAIPDDQAAVRWLLRAAALYDGEAAYRLAIMYVQGRGVGKDYQQAFKWFELARLMSAHYGNEPEPALAARDRMREQLMPRQVAVATADAERTLAALIDAMRALTQPQNVALQQPEPPYTPPEAGLPPP